MTPSASETCTFCPRLCRHVCPVSVATARESAVPSAIVGVVRLATAGSIEASLGTAALDLCLGCGACTRYCALHVDVAAFVRGARGRPEAATLPVLPPLNDAADVRVELPSPDGVEPPPGTILSPDALGHAAWRAGDTQVLRRLASRFAGRTVQTRSFAIAEVLTAAGVAVQQDPAPPTGTRFTTCWEGANGQDGQLTCCGAREGFADRNPDLAHEVAREAARRLGGLPTTCADGHCAAWLRAHGADVRGPDAHEPG